MLTKFLHNYYIISDTEMVIVNNMGQEGYGETWVRTPRQDASERQRLGLQNTEGQAKWGVGHKEYLQKLKSEYMGGNFRPKRIAELGVGPDATLVLNTLEVFGDSLEDGGLVIFELIPDRLKGAKKTLASKLTPDQFKKLAFVQGNAAETLDTQGKFDLINAQLIFQHLLPEQRRQILQKGSQQLNKDGLFVISDLAFNDWQVRLPEDSGRISNKIYKRTLRRGREFISNFRQKIYRDFGKNDFDGKDAIKEMVATESTLDDGKSPLIALDMFDTETHVRDMRRGQPEIEFMGRMLKQTTEKDEVLHKDANWYMRKLRRHIWGRVQYDYPTMVRVTFQRT